MTRQDAFKLVRERLKNKNLIKHSLAVEACMEKLAEKFGEDKFKWALTGLLHDLDYEETKDDFSQHGFVTVRVLENYKVSQEILDAIKAHAGHMQRDSFMAKALYAVDPLAGLIVAAALMHPDRKLKSLDAGFVLNRFKEKRFAKGANRQQIMCCSELGLELKEFIEICLSAMQEISSNLGL